MTLSDKQSKLCDQNPHDFSDLRAAQSRQRSKRLEGGMSLRLRESRVPQLRVMMRRTRDIGVHMCHRVPRKLGVAGVWHGHANGFSKLEAR